MVSPWSLRPLVRSRGLASKCVEMPPVSLPDVFLLPRSRDYALRFERIAEQAVFPSCASSAAETPATIHELAIRPNGSHGGKKHVFSPSFTGHNELAALVDALLRDVRAFASRADVFNTVLVEVRPGPRFRFLRLY